jgi:hypothetical protein
VPGAAQGAEKEFVTSAHEINNLIKGDNLRALKQEGWQGLPDKEIKSIVQKYTPEFDAARAAKSEAMSSTVDPTKKSVVGQIAEMGGGQRPDKVTAKDTAIDLIFNKGRKVSDINKLSETIGGDNVGVLLREHLAKTMQRVWPSELARPETTVGAPAKLVDALAGQSWQRENINAALKSAAEAQGLSPNEVRRGFYQLMQTFETYKDLRLAPGVSAGQTQQQAGKNVIGAAAEPFGTTRRFFGQQATSKTYNKIAEIVMSPNGLEQLQAIAKEPKPERVRAVALSIMDQVSQAERNPPGSIPGYFGEETK